MTCTFWYILLDRTISWTISHCNAFISLPSLHLIIDIFTLYRRTCLRCVLVTVSCQEEGNHNAYDVGKYQYNRRYYSCYNCWNDDGTLRCCTHIAFSCRSRKEKKDIMEERLEYQNPAYTSTMGVKVYLFSRLSNTVSI